MEIINLNIINITSSDIEEDSLENWNPVDSQDMYICLYIEIGALNSEVHSEFSLCVATPQGLLNFANNFSEPLLMTDRNLFVYRRYDYSQLVLDLDNVLCKCCAPTWDESVFRLQRYFQWEYEDRYDESVNAQSQGEI